MRSRRSGQRYWYASALRLPPQSGGAKHCPSGPMSNPRAEAGTPFTRPASNKTAGAAAGRRVFISRSPFTAPSPNAPASDTFLVPAPGRTAAAGSPRLGFLTGPRIGSQGQCPCGRLAAWKSGADVLNLRRCHPSTGGYLGSVPQAAEIDSEIGGSSNGRTADSDSVNLGSNPSPPANRS
jgi:hypothetical protein